MNHEPVAFAKRQRCASWFVLARLSWYRGLPNRPGMAAAKPKAEA